jgi:hypothetical protein
VEDASLVTHDLDNFFVQVDEPLLMVSDVAKKVDGRGERPVEEHSLFVWYDHHRAGPPISRRSPYGEGQSPQNEDGGCEL